jgi:hypothetical protein
MASKVEFRQNKLVLCPGFASPARGGIVSDMVRQYWRFVARRAAIETAAVLRIHSREQIAAWVAVGILAILALAFWGSEDAAWDEIVLRGAFASIILLTLPFIFIWKMLDGSINGLMCGACSLEGSG